VNYVPPHRSSAKPDRHKSPNIGEVHASKIPGKALFSLSVFSDLFAQIRKEMRVSVKEMSKQTGIPEKVIEEFETHAPGSLTLEQMVTLLHGLDCRLELRPVRNKARLDDPFEVLRSR
jgi:hypothetical protein